MSNSRTTPHTTRLPTMTGIEITAPGVPDVLAPRSMPRPVPGPGEVLIRVEAAGVNRPDVLQRLGVYNPPPGASPLPGLEVAGTIAQKGSKVSNWKPGDPVVALTNGGGYAQYVAVPAGQVLPLPKNHSMIEGAALPETLFTVRQTLIDRAGLTSGQSVLIHGGASGIGATAIQMTNLVNATPFTTVSSEEKAAYARQMGAKAVVNYVTQDFVEEINGLTEGRGVDVILDIVGGDYVDRHLKIIAQGGTIIQLALMGGSRAEVNLAPLLMKHVTLFGSTLRPAPDEQKALIARELLRDVWPELESGRMKKPRIRTFPLEQAARAHEAMQNPDHYGKIVLTVEHPA